MTILYTQIRGCNAVGAFSAVWGYEGIYLY